MKKSHFLTFIGVMAVGLLLAGGITPALASTSLNFFSDYQTYVISGSDSPSNTPGSTYADTSFYGKGAMEISAYVADPGVGKNARSMDSLFSFNTAANVTGSAGTYAPATGSDPIGKDIASAYNAVYGAGNWNITSVSVLLASNWQAQGVQPNNPDFNVVNAGLFTFDVLGSNPNITTTTWNSLQSFLPTTTATSVGTFQWTPWAAGTTNNGAEPQWTYNLTLTPELINAIMSGEFSLLGVAADDGVGYVFNTKNRLAPEIIITADAAPVPVPPALWLLSSGVAGLAFVRRRFFA